jgi:hypothetical protein
MQLAGLGGVVTALPNLPVWKIQDGAFRALARR